MLAPRFLLTLVTVSIAFTALAQDLSNVPPGERAEAARLFKIYRESADQPARGQAAEALSQMHYTVMLALVPILERDWQLAVANYLNAVQRVAAEVARKRTSDSAFAREVAALRTTLAKLRAAGDGLTKERLHSEGEPALKRLRELHTITKADLVAAQAALGPAGDAARALTRMRVMLKQKTRLKDERDFTEADLARQESALIVRAFRTDPKAAMVLEANAALSAKSGVPADEIEGIRDLNEMRMLLGLAPVLIDPKLHDAARGHSQDKTTMKFFAHDSPAPGKKTPWDRAKLAGTTASAENIFSGSPNPRATNQAWFFSPGHHVNMFGNHSRVGMGRCEGNWTQMFGR